MRIEPLPILKSDERGIIYDCDKVRFLARKKGTTSGDHIHPEPETLYLVSGTAKLTVDDRTETITAPVKISLEGNVRHKLFALTDIEFIEDR